MVHCQILNPKVPVPACPCFSWLKWHSYNAPCVQSVSVSRARAIPVPAAAMSSVSMRCLLPVAVLLILINAFGVACGELPNMSQGAWSTAQLSVARFALAATRVGNLAMYAGGVTFGAFVLSCKSSLLSFSVLKSPHVFELQVMVFPMLSTFTTVQREHGRRLSSARRVVILQPRASVTWLYLQVVLQVRCSK